MNTTPGSRSLWIKALVVLVLLGLAAGIFFKQRTSRQSAAESVPADVRGQPIASSTPTPPASDAVRGQPIADPSPPVATSLVEKLPSSYAATVESAKLAAIATAPTTTATQTVSQAGEKPGEHLMLGFDKLAAFKYEMPDDPVPTNQVTAAAKPKDQIPPEVRRLDKKLVAIKGFMLPLKVEGGLVTELLIMRDQSMCCYGAVPKINEWVSVKMIASKGIKPIMDQPVTLFGKLHVGEMYENSYLVGIYQMDGEKMAGPLALP